MPTDDAVGPVDLFDLLKNRRRLLVIGYLSLFEEGTLIEVRHLARVIRGIELEKPPRQVSSDDYESAYNGLIQTHLPKLAADDVVEYDDSRKTLSPTYRVNQCMLLVQIARYLSRSRFQRYRYRSEGDLSTMTRITQTTRLERVEYILGSGIGTLDFAIEGEDAYYTWEGKEDADWDVEDIKSIENADEDRFLIFPEQKYFTCEIDVERDVVRCWCDE